MIVIKQRNMNLLKRLFDCDSYGNTVTARPQPGPSQAAPAPASKPVKVKLSDEQREALRELGRKGGKARAAKRAAVKANTPAAALAKSGEASDPPKA